MSWRVLAGIVCSREAMLLSAAGVAALLVGAREGDRLIDGFVDRLAEGDGERLAEGDEEGLAGSVGPEATVTEVSTGADPAFAASLRRGSAQDVSPSPPSSATAMAPNTARLNGVSIPTPSMVLDVSQSPSWKATASRKTLAAWLV
ncbi:hypothetical protein ACIA3K_20135 [Micromonospora sp. NPDC051543]|uniref:hypothetical protein n=1 Tax=Micromonospora sp. NPDC051543 TaxID=3364287 RepID=UPI003793EE7E